MRSPLLLTVLLIGTCMGPLFAQQEETVTLEPITFSSRPLGYWDMSLKFTYLNPEAPMNERRVSEWEVLTVLKGGTAHTSGLESGDCILEVNGQRNMLRTDIENFLRYGEIGDTIELKVRRYRGKTETIPITLHDASWDAFTVVVCDLEVQFPLGCKMFFRKEPEDYYILSQSGEIATQGRNLLFIRRSDPAHYCTPQDKRVHKTTHKKMVVFDEIGNYRIKRSK